MWNLADNEHSIRLIESFLAAEKPIGIVCHSTGALRHVRTPDGKLLVQDREVTGFTNGEEEEVGLTKIVPFLVEDEAETRRNLLEAGRLGSSCGQRRPVDHRTKPAFFRPRSQHPAGEGRRDRQGIRIAEERIDT
jgi:hypothetical protein